MIDKDLFRLLGKNKKFIFIVVIFEIISLLSTTLFSYSISSIINSVWYTRPITFSLIQKEVIFIIVSIAVKVVCDILTVRIKDKLSENVKLDLRNKIFNHILECGNDTEVGMSGLTQLSMEGIEQLDMYYSEYLPQFFYAVTAPFILFFITLSFNFRPALALIVFVPLIPMSIIAVSKYAKKIFAKYWNKYLSMGDAFLDASSGLKDLKIFEADKARHDKMNGEAEEFRKITMKVLVMQLASTTIMDLVAYGGAGVGIATALLNRNTYPEGNITGLIFIILCAIEYFLPMRRFGSAFHVGMNGATAGRKILKIIDKSDINWSDSLVKKTDIKISHATFSYDLKKNVLNDINMSFDSKGLYSIVGESGCGKSTIVKLLKGEKLLKEGEILVGGKNLYSYSRASYYSNLSVISYNSYILDMSIRDNFKIFKKDITEEEMHKYLKLVNLDHFVEISGGLDLIIKEDSNNISGGERQRLALALALASGKNIYIFDEATSSIDIDSEKIIMQNIKELANDKLVILISHRLENVVNSDCIYYLENGCLKEFGKHDDLISSKQGYYNLYNAQKTEEGLYKEVVNYED